MPTENNNGKTILALAGIIATLVGGGGWVVKEQTSGELKYYLLRQEFADFKAAEAERRQTERVRTDAQYYSLLAVLQQIKARLK